MADGKPHTESHIQYGDIDKLIAMAPSVASCNICQPVLMICAAAKLTVQLNLNPSQMVDCLFQAIAYEANAQGKSFDPNRKVH